MDSTSHQLNQNFLGRALGIGIFHKEKLGKVEKAAIRADRLLWGKRRKLCSESVGGQGDGSLAVAV